MSHGEAWTIFHKGNRDTYFLMEAHNVFTRNHHYYLPRFLFYVFSELCHRLAVAGDSGTTHHAAERPGLGPLLGHLDTIVLPSPTPVASSMFSHGG